MSLSNFLDALEKSKLHNTLYHFTDNRNLSSIKSHGLLSLRELANAEIPIPAAGGNDWSHEEDHRRGLDQYVHLCLLPDHPMEFIARRDGRISDTKYLQVSSEVLRFSGVMATTDVANKSGVQCKPIAEIAPVFDVEVLYSRTDWGDQSIQERLKAVKKYEVLVPNKIPVNFLGNL